MRKAYDISFVLTGYVRVRARDCMQAFEQANMVLQNMLDNSSHFCSNTRIAVDECVQVEPMAPEGCD